MNTITVYPLRVKKYWFINYCYIVINTNSRTALLVDPAWELDTIEEQIRSLCATLCGVLLTHSHPDHINHAYTIAIKEWGWVE